MSIIAVAHVAPHTLLNNVDTTELPRVRGLWPAWRPDPSDAPLYRRHVGTVTAEGDIIGEPQPVTVHLEQFDTDPAVVQLRVGNEASAYLSPQAAAILAAHLLAAAHMLTGGAR